MMTERVRAYFHEHGDAFAAFTRALVTEETPSTRPEAQEPVFRRLAEAFDALGYETLRLPGRETGGQLYARPRRRARGAPSQLLLGHCDTVWPLGTLRVMPCERRDGVLRGPGVFDMKAGLAMIVFALRALDALGLTPTVTPLVFVNSDEEIGSFESQARLERLARVSDRALVLEPALGPSGKIKTRRKGTGDFEIVIRGKAAHAGLAPEEGRSAILELTYVVQKLFALNDPATGVTVNVGTLEGGTRANVIAAESRMRVDVRVPTREDAARVEAAIRSLKPTTPGVTLEIRGGMERLPLEQTPRNRALWLRYRALGEAAGVTLEESLAGGASDGNFTSLHTATLDGLGAVGDGAHARHEFIDLDRTLERAMLLTLLLMEPPLRSPNPRNAGVLASSKPEVSG
ncbi:M20 family metallopeptidase [Rhodocaloribacter sp.]